jgi:hypothetical protein
MQPMRRLVVGLLLTKLVAGEPPPTQLMYLSADEELKLAVAIKREYYPWPAMKVGIGQFHGRAFGQIRFFVAPGAGRAQVLRQCRQAALLALRMFPKMVHLDMDCSPHDDSPEAKAVPWFAASLEREKAFKTPLELTPQRWFELQGPLTLREDLHKEGNPPDTLSQQLLVNWNRPLKK